MRQSFCRLSMNDPPTSRLCEKFVVRPSGGSLYLGFRLITNFRLKAELRTSCFYAVSQWVDRSGPAYKRRPPDGSSNPTHGSGWIVQVQPTKRRRLDLFFEYHPLPWVG